MVSIEKSNMERMESHSISLHWQQHRPGR